MESRENVDCRGHGCFHLIRIALDPGRLEWISSMVMACRRRDGNEEEGRGHCCFRRNLGHGNEESDSEEKIEQRGGGEIP